ncbi:NAD(P)-binding domain-containing protein [Bacillus tuaregi]|uniref:NAD(P)-binding domain-containing protein n=1 Tax=Bacillus tuaregi TaxID=1816695 RepID=UPI0008F92227|nr:NAD(P)-binding domain-containing protein [Bacillus tuaregi]
MENYKVGLVGIGRLGSALMKQWDQQQLDIGVYHPTKEKSETFINQFQNGYILEKKDLAEINILILALSGKDISPFLENLRSEGLDLTKVMLVNMATALNSKEIISAFPQLTVFGVKFMGHARDLFEHGEALFISETPLPGPIEELFQKLGQIMIDEEDRLVQVNKLATFYAAKAAIEIEAIFAEKGLSAEYVKRALTSIAPEVIRSYSNGSLGHFAKEIVKEIQLSKSK